MKKSDLIEGIKEVKDEMVEGKMFSKFAPALAKVMKSVEGVEDLVDKHIDLDSDERGEVETLLINFHEAYGDLSKFLKKLK